jgi:hypothetical protein
MLGASRQATGVIIDGLENDRHIQTSRRILEILDRERLESMACECYWAVKEELDTLSAMPQEV